MQTGHWGCVHCPILPGALKSEALLGRCQTWTQGSVPGWSIVVLGTQPQRDITHPVLQKPQQSLGSWETAGWEGLIYISPYPLLGEALRTFSPPQLHPVPRGPGLLRWSDSNPPWIYLQQKLSVGIVFLCLATFTSGPATQKTLLTSCGKEKRLGLYLGKWKGKLPTAKEQKTNYYFNKLSYPLYICA